MSTATVKNFNGTHEIEVDCEINSRIGLNVGINTPCWFHFAMTPAQAREMATILTAMADEIDTLPQAIAA